jgi:hypothetical protein
MIFFKGSMLRQHDETDNGLQFSNLRVQQRQFQTNSVGSSSRPDLSTPWRDPALDSFAGNSPFQRLIVTRD